MTTLAAILVSASALGATSDGVLLDFTATWCGPCQQMSPIVSRLQRQGYPIRKVDIDREPALARKYDICSIPTFVLVVNGREVGRIEGITNEGRLKGLLAKIPRSPEPKAVATTPNRRPAAKSLPAESIPTAAQARQQPPERTRSLPFSLFRKKAQGGERQAEQPREEPVVRAKHDGLGDAADATVIDPLAASVRIRVTDGDGINFGSGTIIDSRQGRTIVLTCGHIFRGLNEKSRIEVDVFLGDRHETFVGKIIRYDTTADVGLCSIPTDTALPVSRVAPVPTRVVKNDRVFSIGCGGGEPPSKQHLLVTALNRYLGPDNIECTGVPVQGRSGGGLFNESGDVIGVCIYADPRDRRGLYAGLKSIHTLLDQAELARLYQRSISPPGSFDRSRERQTELAAGASIPSSRMERLDGGDVRPVMFDLASEPSRDLASEPSLDLKALAESALEQVDAARSGGDPAGEAEVVCIIRPLDNPRAVSRVVIINRASPKFFSYLAREVKDQPQPTMHSVKFAGWKPAGPQPYRRSAESR